MTDVAENVRRVRDRIRAAAERSGRPPDAVRLIAVTKTVQAEHIQQAISSGVTDIGENRLQEALTKKAVLDQDSVAWHFIGRFQTNKAKKIAANFDWVHSIDRLEAAGALARAIQDTARRSMPIMIEVKLFDEMNKSGLAVDAVPALVDSIRRLDSLELRGLMAIPPPCDDPEDARPFFRRLRDLSHSLELQELSMGMTHDYEVAVEEGATMVRVGAGIFGARESTV